MTYSNKIFDVIFNTPTPKKGGITAEMASNILAVAGSLSTIASIFVVRRFPRRYLLIPGFFLVSVCNLLISVCDIHDSDIGAIIAVVLCVMSFFVLNQPVAYLYMYEVGMDATLGLCKLSLFSFQLVMVILTPFLVYLIGCPMTFGLFSLFSFVGGIFVTTMIRETNGLSDKEKKRLYCPQETRDNLDPSKLLLK